MSERLNAVLALLLGAALTLAYAPFSQWWLPWVVVPVWLYLVSKSEKPTQQGFVFGLGWFGAGVSWVHVSIAQFGGLPLVGSLGLMALLIGYLSIYPALFARVLKRFPVAYWPLACGGLWLLSEWLRGWMLSGFPWLSLGYSQVSGPLGPGMAVIGETGMSVLMVVIGASVAVFTSQAQRQWRQLLPLALLPLIVAASAVEWTTPTGVTPKAVMVQGNIKQELRWVPEQDQPTMDKYLRLSEPHWDADIMLWPEAAIPRIEPLANDYLVAVDALATETHTGFITGIVNYSLESGNAYNNLLALGQQGTAQALVPYRYFHNSRYAKHHLLPIGEFIPFESFLRGLAPIFDLPMSSFTRGDYRQTNLKAKGYDLAPAICFEIAFPRQLRSNMTDQTDIIVTVSNDAWFGDSHGPAQHLEIAQARAIEFGLPVMRATNTGITAFVDHRGKILDRLPQFEEGVLSHNLPLVAGKTPYRALGDSPLWLLGLLTLMWSMYKNQLLPGFIRSISTSKAKG